MTRRQRSPQTLQACPSINGPADLSEQQFEQTTRNRLSTSSGIEYLAILESGSYFGELSMVKQIAHTATVQSITPCVLLSLPRDKFYSYFSKNPQMLAEFDLKIYGEEAELIHVVRHTFGHQLFREHLQQSFCEENLDFWKAVQDLKREHLADQVSFELAAKAIRDKYVVNGAECQVNLPAGVHKSTLEMFNEEPLRHDCFDAAVQEILTLMETDSYHQFKHTAAFNDLFVKVGAYRHLTGSVIDRIEAGGARSGTEFQESGAIHVGDAVVHGIRGDATVVSFDVEDRRGRPFVVQFANGEEHHYSFFQLHTKFQKVEGTLAVRKNV